MKLGEVVSGISAFGEWNHAEKIKFFVWFLHTFESKETANVADIRRCYDEIHVAQPSAIPPFLKSLTEKKNPELIKSNGGFRLERACRNTFDEKFGQRVSTVEIAKLLAELPLRVPNIDERNFLTETLKCLRVEANRAAIVMAWNLAYFHLLSYVLNDKGRLDRFNSAWLKRYPKHHKNGDKVVTKFEDFSEELKESEVIEICNTASLITSDAHKILVGKLGRRNSAAHPSKIEFKQLQAEEFVDDLVRNVVLQLT